MLVFRESKYFTTHREVLIAPRAPIDPECACTRPRTVKPAAMNKHEVTTRWLENQQKAAAAVDPMLFHALAFPLRAGCFEHSELLTVTSVGAPDGA